MRNRSRAGVAALHHRLISGIRAGMRDDAQGSSFGCVIPGSPTPDSSTPMFYTQRAGLDCCELAPRGETEVVIVICHGFGAPGDDLVPLGAEIARAVPSLGQSARFVFPQGPLSLESLGWGDARAWWMIDMAKLQQAQPTGQQKDPITGRYVGHDDETVQSQFTKQLRDLRTERPIGMPEARDQLVELLIEPVCRGRSSSSAGSRKEP